AQGAEKVVFFFVDHAVDLRHPDCESVGKGALPIGELREINVVERKAVFGARFNSREIFFAEPIELCCSAETFEFTTADLTVRIDDAGEGEETFYREGSGHSRASLPWARRDLKP